MENRNDRRTTRRTRMAADEGCQPGNGDGAARIAGRVLLEAKANSVGFANVTAEVSRIRVRAFAKWKRRNWRE
jgi:hypothetical protein